MKTLSTPLQRLAQRSLFDQTESRHTIHLHMDLAHRKTEKHRTPNRPELATSFASLRTKPTVDPSTGLRNFTLQLWLASAAATRTFGSAIAEPLAVWLITTPSEPMVVNVGMPRTPSLAASARLRVASPKGIAAQGISPKYLIQRGAEGGG